VEAQRAASAGPQSLWLAVRATIQEDWAGSEGQETRKRLEEVGQTLGVDTVLRDAATLQETGRLILDSSRRTELLLRGLKVQVGGSPARTLLAILRAYR
jgi:hypothetical protein